MPKAMTQFDRVVALGGDRNRFRTWLSALAATPALLALRYEVRVLRRRMGGLQE